VTRDIATGIPARTVFVAGATGAIGRQLVPMLLAAGHRVIGTTRSEARLDWLRDVGAEAVIVDAFDAESVRRAMVAASPDVVIHQLTDLAAGFDRDQLRANARLREVGTRNLVEAMAASGARRLIAQSGAFVYATGPLPHTETDPLRAPRGPDDPVLTGLLELERLTTTSPGLEGLALRYGYLYGPGTVSDGPEDLPSVHVAAAASAAVLAVDRGTPGIYNIVDDDGPVSNRLARETLGWRPGTRA
jgi:nucleoside-diphosphate-sugar epimerase